MRKAVYKNTSQVAPFHIPGCIRALQHSCKSFFIHFFQLFIAYFFNILFSRGFDSKQIAHPTPPKKVHPETSLLHFLCLPLSASKLDTYWLCVLSFFRPAALLDSPLQLNPVKFLL